MRPGPSRGATLLSSIVFVVGLIGAYAAGTYTYREVGIYGGPVASGFFREWDPAKKHYQLVHLQKQPDGQHIRRLYTDYLTLQRTDMQVGESPMIFEPKPDGTGLGRIGFSLGNDGVIDSWLTRDPVTGNTRVEISTKRNGRVDRWEHYENNALVRVDLDTNGNGKPDRWMTYQNGIQVATILDVNEDGKPDSQ